MAAYTAQTSVKKPVARLFVKTTKLTDAQCDTVITSGKIPTTGFVQLGTADGGVVFDQARATTDLYSQQNGVEDVAVDTEMASLTLTMDSVGLQELMNICVINTASTGDALSGIGLKENRGALLSTKGVSFLFYDKSYDANNETNVPAVTDPEIYVFFNCVCTSNSQITYNNVQQTYTITFRCLASQSSGSARGYYGRAGVFTAV